MCKNAKSALKNGKEVTDMLGFFVKSGYVAGPFSSPPLKDFRVNSLLAVEQDTKVRPCLNVSLPKDCSFNDNVDEFLVEKVYMTSARSFGHAVLDCGIGAKMSKFDMCDAYKLMPAKPSDYRLQGLSWLNKFFVETQQIFGAETAVCNFDALGHTLQTVAVSMANIPSQLVFRQLDDLPFVAPASTNWCEELSEIYTTICSEVNVTLAKECPKLDKAFVNSTKGKVLGIWFDTETLSWSYPLNKRKKMLKLIYDVFYSLTADKEELESLVGRMNDFSLMCPFMRSYKKNTINLLTEVLTFPHQAIKVNENVKRDLKTWWAVIEDEALLPICPRSYEPTLAKKVFTSDAAGLPENCKLRGRVGVGLVGLDETGHIILAFQHMWSNDMLMYSKDEKGTRMADKTTCLELVGVLLPLVICPEKLMNQHIVLQVDNMAAVWGWEKNYVSGDNMASILLRCIVLLSARLGTIVHVSHLPRVSDWEARLADRLSRERTIS
jgi:hypothetical protein